MASGGHSKIIAVDPDLLLGNGAQYWLMAYIRVVAKKLFASDQAADLIVIAYGPKELRKKISAL